MSPAGMSTPQLLVLRTLTSGHLYLLPFTAKLMLRVGMCTSLRVLGVREGLDFLTQQIRVPCFYTAT